MTGLPTPEEFEADIIRMHRDTLRVLADAEASGDIGQAAELRKLKAQSDKLLWQRGIDPRTIKC